MTFFLDGFYRSGMWRTLQSKASVQNTHGSRQVRQIHHHSHPRCHISTRKGCIYQFCTETLKEKKRYNKNVDSHPTCTMGIPAEHATAPLTLSLQCWMCIVLEVPNKEWMHKHQHNLSRNFTTLNILEISVFTIGLVHFHAVWRAA